MYNNEDTILDRNQGNAANDNERTIVDQTAEESTVNENNGSEQKTEVKKSDKLRNIAINGGMGFAVGTLGALLMSMSLEKVEELQNGENTVETPDTPVTTDGTLPVAHSVNDSMSFGQAFNAAHNEVGPGGVFEWHGQLYNTYTAEEWNSLSPEEKHEFASHLKVVGTTDYESNVEHHEAHHEAHAEVAHANESHAHDSQQQTTPAHNNNAHNAHPQTAEVHEVQTAEVHEVQTAEVVGQEEPVVEVLGVQNVTLDDGQNVTVGGVTVNGQEVVVIDVDNDGQGDIIASDLNGDGRLDDSEIADISSDPIAMSNFETGGEVDTTGEIDYLS